MALTKVQTELFNTGAILQCVAISSVLNATANNPAGGSGIVWVDLITASFTPKRANSKIVMIGNAGAVFNVKGNNGAAPLAVEFNGVTKSNAGYPYYPLANATGSYSTPMSVSMYFISGTTNPVTVKLKGGAYNEAGSTNACQIMWGGANVGPSGLCESSLIIMEVAQ